MSYRSYEAVNCEELDEEVFGQHLEGEWAILAIDAAKERPYAGLYTVDRSADRPEQLVVRETVFEWRHPWQTEQVVEKLEECPAETMEVIVEPSGSYPKGLIERVQEIEGVEMRRMRGKKTRGSKENYDNVPSMHDPKAADVMARVHVGGGSEVWRQARRRERQLKAASKRVDRLKAHRHQDQGRLEGELGAYWPELIEQLGLDSTTLLRLVEQFGKPREVAEHPEQARELIMEVSRGQIGLQRATQIVRQAANSVGAKAYPEEVSYLKELAEDLLERKRRIREGEKRIEQLQEGDEVAERIAEMAGPMVAASLVGEVGDPRDFEAAGAYQKAAGLNLVEDTSGQEGQHSPADESPPMRISKRGSSRARKYLYLAAQRWIQWCPVARAWYQQKVAQNAGRDGKKKVALVALMRKLLDALYHVGRGAEYRPGELFDVERLIDKGYYSTEAR